PPGAHLVGLFRCRFDADVAGSASHPRRLPERIPGRSRELGPVVGAETRVLRGPALDRMSALPTRLGCSTISMQHLSLRRALDEIAGLGFSEIDLGALPGVCDHVPFDLTDDAIELIADEIRTSGLRVRTVNGDVGDLNVVAPDPGSRRAHIERLARLSAAI